VRTRHGFWLIGYVVMPEHVHLLLTEPVKGNPSKVLQVLKQKVSAALRRARRKSWLGQLALRFPEAPADEKHFWQGRFYDFNVYSHRKKKEKLDYMHGNPVVRGLVTHPKDWPWSSFSFYARDEVRLLEIDVVDL
jgi:REP-associated tyrosine transposase